MKKILILFSLLFVPNFCWALDDACTKPDEYTIDKRCYVTDAQKKTKPYNAVVALLDNDYNGFCTGTMVRYNGGYYLYTAKHCTAYSKACTDPYLRVGKMAGTLAIKLQDDTILDVALNAAGCDTVDSDDWAIYEIVNDDNDKIAYVETSNKTKWSNKDYGAKLVGYGSLKIMSDKEINEFKEIYSGYLKNRKNIKSDGSEIKYGWLYNGVNTDNEYVEVFIANMSTSYFQRIFEDNKYLKVSNCIYSGKSERKGCQSWGGNSGGGVFDDEGNLMAIHSSGYHIIGGVYHASPDIPGTRGTGTVNLLKEPWKTAESERVKPKEH